MEEIAGEIVEVVIKLSCKGRQETSLNSDLDEGKEVHVCSMKEAIVQSQGC